MVGLVLLLGAVGAGFYLYGYDSGPSHPAEWDSRVAELAVFVEQARGLEFDRPIFVDFLDEQEYSEFARVEESEFSDADREYADDLVAMSRALGLMEGEVDLLTAENELYDAGTLGFYSSDTERITVRGDELTSAVRVTLVHELTHALQDQNFDLDRLEDTEDPAVAGNLRAVAEGDAIRIENEYIDELPADEQEEYYAQTEADVTQTEQDLSDVPDVMSTLFGSTYLFGESFVQVLYEDGGTAGVNGALEDPPLADEQLLDPLTYLQGDAPEQPELAGDELGDEVIEEGTFGAVYWYVVLSERIDAHEALDAVEGWAGDAYVAYRSGGEVCVSSRYLAETDEDASEMERALGSWLATMPGEVASVERDGNEIALDACDPGPDAEIGVTGNSGDALILPYARSIWAASYLGQGIDLETSFCAADQVVEQVGVEELVNGDEEYFTSPEFQSYFLDALEACR
ncbi:MAG: hypothetical protein JJLCMIEE_00492 [Acidimicrobiales bacterium]|nr:MAG: hypothetical protein EDR02_04045 [Actinomycetota bacterium]MBV6507444.1 hypothetical protein [Acidimicrobiales bacterium]RIK07824.1 MAG: hypothetical protein DCC48_02410 [Acidobacteriota bacterium]